MCCNIPKRQNFLSVTFINDALAIYGFSASLMRPKYTNMFIAILIRISLIEVNNMMNLVNFEMYVLKMMKKVSEKGRI